MNAFDLTVNGDLLNIDNPNMTGNACYNLSISWGNGQQVDINGGDLPTTNTYDTGMYPVSIDVSVGDLDCYNGTFDEQITDTENITTANQIDIYPNPTEQEITVRWQGQAVYQQLTVLDLNGRQLYQQTLTDGAQLTEVDMRRFPAGVYLVQLRTEDGQLINRRVVKQ